ncbi:hypothetical protein ACLOJK_007005 [Asimina triloba]
MPPRKVPRVIPGLRIKEERPLFRRLGIKHPTTSSIVTQGEQYQTLLLTMEDNIDTRGDDLSCPLSYGRNEDKQTSLCHPW